MSLRRPAMAAIEARGDGAGVAGALYGAPDP